ncbi:integral membrane protein [Talaromyces proteolyticus]|uniref:Integral membrane protein n=1 Tax=Talaromyces proteolyticus TaxID=1131652 RepID=A0AAD4L2S6_9EURO|nr:uncharacterized protein BGW36DRAFT_366334 [Talaromyces proteolyticus]KAH8704872.1 integral membrane protein [Talaromyces proteolyticus]
MTKSGQESSECRAISNQPEGRRYLNTSPYLKSEVAFNRFTIFCGPFAQMLFFIFLPASRNFPPISPHKSPEETVEHYLQNESALRATAALMSMTPIFWPLFCAGVNRQLSRIPGVSQTALYAQLASGSLAAVTMMVPSFLFATTVYRLDRDPNITQALSDLSWLTFSMGWTPSIAQDVAISYAILQDRRPNPLFPRWLAFVNTGLTVFLYPSLGVHCVHGGALAWNGAITFWVGAAAFFIQLNLLVFFLMRAVGRPDEPSEPASESGTPSESD